MTDNRRRLTTPQAQELLDTRGWTSDVAEARRLGLSHLTVNRVRAGLTYSELWTPPAPWARNPTGYRWTGEEACAGSVAAHAENCSWRLGRFDCRCGLLPKSGVAAATGQAPCPTGAYAANGGQDQSCTDHARQDREESLSPSFTTCTSEAACCNLRATT